MQIRLRISDFGGQEVRHRNITRLKLLKVISIIRAGTSPVPLIVMIPNALDASQCRNQRRFVSDPHLCG